MSHTSEISYTADCNECPVPASYQVLNRNDWFYIFEVQLTKMKILTEDFDAFLMTMMWNLITCADTVHSIVFGQISIYKIF